MPPGARMTVYQTIRRVATDPDPPAAACGSARKAAPPHDEVFRANNSSDTRVRHWRACTGRSSRHNRFVPHTCLQAFGTRSHQKNIPEGPGSPGTFPDHSHGRKCMSPARTPLRSRRSVLARSRNLECSHNCALDSPSGIRGAFRRTCRRERIQWAPRWGSTRGTDPNREDSCPLPRSQCIHPCSGHRPFRSSRSGLPKTSRPPKLAARYHPRSQWRR